MTLLYNVNRTLQRRRNSTWHALGYDTTIRPERTDDHSIITALTCNAFKGDAEARLITALREQSDSCISLVAEQHGNIVGHILFSPATLDNAPQTRLMALAPMAVSDVLQHQGIGSALVRAGLKLCEEQGIEAVVVLGHPAYYPRFGFTAASKFRVSCPWQVPDNTFMLLELQAGSLSGKSGKVVYQPAFAQL